MGQDRTRRGEGLTPGDGTRPVRPAARALYSSGEIASLLRRSAEWFYEHRVGLIARGMPGPLDLPGHPRWSKAQIDAWLAGIDRRAVAKLPPLSPANDPAPLPAPEGRAWEPYLRTVYAQRN